MFKNKFVWLLIFGAVAYFFWAPIKDMLGKLVGGFTSLGTSVSAAPLTPAQTAAAAGAPLVGSTIQNPS